MKSLKKYIVDQERLQNRLNWITERSRSGHISISPLTPGLAADRKLLVSPPGYHLALGLDLGTRCGYSYTFFKPGVVYPVGQDPVYLGQFDLSAGPYESGAIRFVVLRQMVALLSPNIVFYEEPRFNPDIASYGHRSFAAVLGRALPSAEFLAALKGTICSFCEERSIPCRGYPIGSIKKFATGKGNASKEEVIKGVSRLIQLPLDPDGYESSGVDNMADSAAVLLLGLSEHALGMSDSNFQLMKE